ncbi:hypothetical protein MASR1M32_24020 [Rhodobacter sp.]
MRQDRIRGPVRAIEVACKLLLDQPREHQPGQRLEPSAKRDADIGAERLVRVEEAGQEVRLQPIAQDRIAAGKAGQAFGLVFQPGY